MNLSIGYIADNMLSLNDSAFRTPGVLTEKDRRDLLTPKEGFFSRRWRDDFYDPNPGKVKVIPDKRRKKVTQ